LTSVATSENKGKTQKAKMLTRGRKNREEQLTQKQALLLTLGFLRSQKDIERKVR